MRAPAFLTTWLLTFAVAASAAAMGGALLLDRDLRRERAGAAARTEMDAFIDGKLVRQVRGTDAPAVMKGLVGQAGSHGAADMTAEVARFRAESSQAARGDRVFLYRRGALVSGSQTVWPAAPRAFGQGLVRLILVDGGEAIAAQHRFANGDTLLIGRRVEQVDPLSGRVLRIGGLTLLGLIAAGGAIGWLFSIGYSRRLRAITQACEQVEAGQMSARAPDAERSDEFGLLARNVNRMLDRVARYVEGMRDVSDEIAHDLRTPLNRVQTRLLAVGDTLGPARNPDLDLATQDLRDLGRVIDDFLWLREIESGQGGETSFFDLKALAGQVAEDHALLAHDAKGVTLTVEGDPTEVMGVKSLLIRALDNIVGNAVKFTPPQGAITVRAFRAGDVVELVVEDTGPGLPDDLLSRAIQPGVRGPHAGAGHGLGLAIAACVARRHGGDVTLENRAEGGLRVRLRLPAPRP